MKNKKNVYETYDLIADWYTENRSIDLQLEHYYLQEFTNRLKPGANILDLGCGTGLPIARFFINEGLRVTGIDGSSKMLEYARKNVPEASFKQMDMRNLAIDKKFEAVIAWHSSFHLPIEDQRNLFGKISDWLLPGGLLLFTSGPDQGEVWGNNGGQDIYHASLTSLEYRKILEDQGLTILIHNIEDQKAGGATVWLARYGNAP
jgi:ubiquinone/menaquinone biosynthesis C-methylase UbiE